MNNQLSLSWTHTTLPPLQKIVFIFICHLQPSPKYHHNTLISNILHGCRCSALSATICNHLQLSFMGCLCWGRGVPSPSIWVADKAEHLQPRQVFDKQRVRPHFKDTVAELQIKSKTMFVQLLYKIKRPPLAHLPKKL